MIDRAVVQANAGDLAGAESSLNQCLAGEPNNVRALINLGILLTARRAYENAEPVLRRAAALAPNVETVGALARALQAAGKRDEAEGLYRDIVKGAPGDVPALVGLADSENSPSPRRENTPAIRAS